MLTKSPFLKRILKKMLQVFPRLQSHLHVILFICFYKIFYKVKKFYLDNPEKKVVILNETDFKFLHPVDVLQDE